MQLPYLAPVRRGQSRSDLILLLPLLAPIPKMRWAERPTPGRMVGGCGVCVCVCIGTAVESLHHGDVTDGKVRPCRRCG